MPFFSPPCLLWYFGYYEKTMLWRSHVQVLWPIAPSPGTRHINEQTIQLLQPPAVDWVDLNFHAFSSEILVITELRNGICKFATCRIHVHNSVSCQTLLEWVINRNINWDNSIGEKCMNRPRFCFETPTSHIRIPRVKFISSFQFSFLLTCIVESSTRWHKCWSPYHHVGDSKWVPGSWLWPGKSPSAVSIWGIDQWIRYLSAYLSNK